jgi:hypothetical protein
MGTAEEVANDQYRGVKLRYGAVEIGVHRFYHPDDKGNVGEAKFIHVWQNRDGAWKITRVISYDHGAAK